MEKMEKFASIKISNINLNKRLKKDIGDIKEMED